jgi:hypothetical protein
VESRLISLLNDPDFDIRLAAVYALGERGDPAAIEPLEKLRNSGDIPSGGGLVIEQRIARIKNPRAAEDGGANAESAGNQRQASGSQQPGEQIVERLDKIDRNLAEMNERLKKIEQQQAARVTP